MNVGELKEILKDLDDDMELIVQKDSEGNGYSPLSGADPESVYVPCSAWSGDVYDLEWDAEDCGMEEDEWEEMRKRPRCVVLYPVV